MTENSRPLPWHRLVGTTIFAFGLGVSINVLEPAMLGHQMLKFAPAWKNLALGAATFLGLLVAMLTQPLVGALSDRTRTRFGRRVPYLIGGTVVVVIGHFLIAFAPSLAVVVLSLLLLQLASNTVQGPWQALIPDQVPGAQRGRAAGLKTTFDILAFIVGRQAGGMLIAQERLAAAASVAATAFAGALVITLITSSEGLRSVPASGPRDLREAFSVPWRNRPNFSLWFLNRLLFWGSLTAINTFILFYLVDAISMSEPAAQRLVGDVAAVIGVAVLFTALPVGWLSDRVGRRGLVAGSGLLAAGGTVLLLALRSPLGVTLAAGVLGLGTGVYLSGSWALVTDLVPAGQAARYMGIANIASAGGSAIARALGAGIVDPFNRALDSQFAGYAVLYGLAAASFVFASLLMLRLEEDEAADETPPAHRKEDTGGPGSFPRERG